MTTSLDRSLTVSLSLLPTQPSHLTLCHSNRYANQSAPPAVPPQPQHLAYNNGFISLLWGRCWYGGWVHNNSTFVPLYVSIHCFTTTFIHPLETLHLLHTQYSACLSCLPIIRVQRRFPRNIGTSTDTARLLSRPKTLSTTVLSASH